MSTHRYKAWNGPMATTAAQQSVATGITIKTMLQLATPATRQITVISWGFSLSSAQAGTVELLETDVAATVTAHVASGLQPLLPGVPASLLTTGSSTATGYTASAEGTVATTRSFDSQQIAGVAGDNELNYDYQYLPDERPVVAISKFLRVRATFAVSANLQCYVCWEE